MIDLDESSRGSKAPTGVTSAFVEQRDTPSLPVDIALKMLDRSLGTFRRIVLAGLQV